MAGLASRTVPAKVYRPSMASQQPANRDLASRLNTIEEELASQRRALAALAERIGVGDLEALIEELADKRMSEEHMEAAFDRLDASLDAAR